MSGLTQHEINLLILGEMVLQELTNEAQEENSAGGGRRKTKPRYSTRNAMRAYGEYYGLYDE